MDKKLLNVKEVCDYLGVCESKARQIMKRKDSTYTVRIGNRLYVDKELFDKFLQRCVKYQIKI